MDYFRSILASFAILFLLSEARAASFDENYYVVWGQNHFSNQGTEIQLWMDRSSGAGFSSKAKYGSGFFEMRIKLPDKNSAGVVTAFYLSSEDNDHNELDFEFLGNREGRPITLQTNVFIYGVGNREQRIVLWFDPVADFHSYQILWNERHIVFFVDNIPIRELKNMENMGVGYLTKPMSIEGSLWNGEDWATDGGLTKIDWAQSPFVAHFQDFDINGCPLTAGSSSDMGCFDSSHWWNGPQYSALDPVQQQNYENVRKNYMSYDYCIDRRNRNQTIPPECPP